MVVAAAACHYRRRCRPCRLPQPPVLLLPPVPPGVASVPPGTHCTRMPANSLPASLPHCADSKVRFVLMNSFSTSDDTKAYLRKSHGGEHALQACSWQSCRVSIVGHLRRLASLLIASCAAQSSSTARWPPPSKFGRRPVGRAGCGADPELVLATSPPPTCII